MNKRKLLAKARNNPKGLRFAEAVLLAEAHGFRLDRRRGSHQMFEHPAVPDQVNLQRRPDGKAKGYQVRQLLGLIDKYGLRLGEDE